MDIKEVEGKDIGNIMLYALSTCPWCKKTKALLNGMGVKYSYVDVDLLPEDEEMAVEEELSHWTDDMAFPTLIINGQKVIVGFREQEIRRTLESLGA
ncbi:glutaredoxin family protein [Coprothermobacter platensis]|uniref:glutaredoxin family protein n=1 Tax=Coprothermobacter platensis TaxID=108819 RepID=UPI0003632257|nr:glutaredoxin family protein [Coprothermobacter platensis]